MLSDGSLFTIGFSSTENNGQLRALDGEISGADISDNERKIMFDDLDDFRLTDYEVLLFLCARGPMTRVRIMKLCLLFHWTTRTEDGRFWQGYSDDVEESVEGLIAKGMIRDKGGMLAPTGYGKRLGDMIGMSLRLIPNICDATEGFGDRELVAATFGLCGKAAVNPATERTVNRFAGSICLDDTPLREFPEEGFRERLTGGKPIRVRKGPGRGTPRSPQLRGGGGNAPRNVE